MIVLGHTPYTINSHFVLIHVGTMCFKSNNSCVFLYHKHLCHFSTPTVFNNLYQNKILYYDFCSTGSNHINGRDPQGNITQ